MALNFPNSPTNGQTHTDATTGESWVYEAATNSWTSEGLVDTTGGIKFKGDLDTTAAPPAGVSSGWQYAASKTGTAHAGFGPGVTGTVTKGDVLMYTGTGWIETSHSVPDATAAVKGIDTQKWTRTGTELSPTTAGDSVFTTGAVKVGGTTAKPNIQVKADGGIVANTDGLVYDAVNKRLGLGASSPSSLLEVGASLKVKEQNTTTIANERGLTIYQDQSNGSFDSTLVFGNSTNSYFAIGHHNGTSYSERVRIDSSGRVGVGSNLPQGTIHIKAAAATTPLIVEGPSSEFARIDSSGRLLVGTSSVVTTSYSSGRIQLATPSGGIFVTSRDDSTVSGNTLIGGLSLWSKTTTNHEECASIFAHSDATYADGNKPTRLVFSTNAGAPNTSPTERMRIKSNGTINFSNVATYADNTAAKAGGLVAGDIYRTATGQLMITF